MTDTTRGADWRGENKGLACEFGTAAGSNLIIEFKKAEETTASGIVMPMEVVNKQGNASMTAMVLSIGQAAWADQPCDSADVGDIVVLARYTGVKLDGVPDNRDVRFATDLQVLAIK